jgi:hypothetical protein
MEATWNSAHRLDKATSSPGAIAFTRLRCHSHFVKKRGCAQLLRPPAAFTGIIAVDGHDDIISDAGPQPEILDSLCPWSHPPSLITCAAQRFSLHTLMSLMEMNA